MVERKLVVQWSGLKFGAVSSIVSLPYLRLTACSELSCLGIFTELNLDTVSFYAYPVEEKVCLRSSNLGCRASRVASV